MNDKHSFYFRLATSFAIFCALLIPSHFVFAASSQYSAVQQLPLNTYTIAPDTTQSISLSFKNTGSTTWKNSGKNFVSLYAHTPKYRDSIFADASWFYKKSQPAKLTETTVAPGEIGHFAFLLHAPKTEGTYSESFKLASEDIAWIDGSDVTLSITVAVAKPIPANPVITPVSTTTSSTEEFVVPSAFVLIRSAKKVVTEPNQMISYTVGVKNTGSVPWSKRSLYQSGIKVATLPASKAIAIKEVGTVAPGSMDLIDFSFRAPHKKGLHTVKYVLAVDGQVVPDLEIDIPVEVTSDAPEIIDAERNENAIDSTATDVASYGIIHAMDRPEPMMRVGVMIVDEETDNKIDVSCATDWKLMDGDGGLLAELKANEPVEAFYKKERYWYNRGKGLEKSNSFLRFIPNEPNAVCKVENWDRRVTRDSDRAYNRFRNILELRYNEVKSRTWLINEIPMELYLRGLGETSNISHLEFQKTLVTTARTYALYHFERNTKHDGEFYHVTSYSDDQVYRGYDQEEVSPRLVESVKATEGVVVQYEGKTAITPYFSRSAGRTLDWDEVWHGEVAWIKSVPCPCDLAKGKTLWGHGVGLSASEALCMANNGSLWKDILKYFYTGIDLTERWHHEE